MSRITKHLIIWPLVLGALGAAWFFWQDGESTAAPEWRLVEVSTGDVTATVGATGTLGAIRTVEVGTQVSGQIVELRADFNDRVKKGQLIARLDDTLLEQAVRQAEAELSRTQSDLVYKRYLLEQAETLRASSNLAETDLRSAKLAVAQAEAAQASAQAGLDRARRNLSYAEIVAPISGVVINRTVEPGQTVAASLQAPQLFLIAESLERMQILAAVDESDIGRVHVDQPVEFTVQAWPERTFTGVVRQIRMQPVQSENVVNYTVVVEVDNPGGVLMPGMTATLDFIVEKAEGVLLVPNAALRFKPSDEILAEVKKERAARQDSMKTAAGGEGKAAADSGGEQRARRQRMAAGPGGDPHGPSSMRAMGGGHNGRGGRGKGPTILWVLKDGKPRPMPITAGLTDGTNTQVSGKDVREGLQVIAGMVSTGESKGSNPFQPQSQQPMGPPRGGF